MTTDTDPHDVTCPHCGAKSGPCSDGFGSVLTHRDDCPMLVRGSRSDSMAEMLDGADSASWGEEDAEPEQRLQRTIAARTRKKRKREQQGTLFDGGGS